MIHKFVAIVKRRIASLKADIPAAYLALKDKKTPRAAKILAGITIAYALSPLDLIPDFIPILGCVDDFLLLPAMIALIVKLIPKDVWENCRRDAECLWANGKPKKWFYSIPIIIIWALLAWALLKSVLIHPNAK